MVITNTKKAGFLAAVWSLVFFACATKSSAPLPQGDQQEGPAHQGESMGQDLPVWLQTYLEAGEAGLEKLPDYDGYYCFVCESAGPDIQALQAWAEDSALKQIPSLAKARFARKFPGKSYAPGIAEKAASASYSSFLPINDWWVKAAGKYKIYVFYTIDKALFGSRIDEAVKAAPPASPREEEDLEKLRRIVEKGEL